MLFGYYAFEGGNFDYARANLLLMAKDDREDGLLSICFPCNSVLAIPSFSLHYFSSIEEYTRYSGDLSLAREIYGKLVSIMNVFFSNMNDGMIYDFKSSMHWNFYDWATGLDGHPMLKETTPKPDCVLNCLAVRALDAFEKTCNYIDMPFPYEGKAEALRRRIREVFYRQERGLFAMNTEGYTFNVLSNVLAVLADVVKGDEAKALCDRALTAGITDCTLSLKAIKYDALLKADAEKYSEFVLNEIKSDYTPMLKAGATSVWETVDGAIAFGNAGSLCHGWSAAPVYYYHRLGIAEYID
jgi:glycogen debranching enzyme